MSGFIRRLLAPLLCVLNLAGAPAALAQKQERPSLVVLLVFDGLRYDDLETWRSRFEPGGFRRLLEGGAVFDAARYPYATTMTCPGHATLSTGTLPGRHGIIANSWFDRAAGAKVSCVEDAASPLLDGAKGPGASPRRLLAPTLADQLLAARGGTSRALGLALKDRAAVLLAGQKGRAFWWGDAGFTTSRHYGEQLPDYVRAWNARRTRFEGGTWERFMEPKVYAPLGKDDDTRERPPAGLGRTFPHPLKSTEAVLFSPFGAQWLFDFALASVKAEQLGLRPGARDLLAVGVSTGDLVSHTFGPDSHEALDTLLRLDRALAAFLDGLEKQVGLSRVLVAATADHGMTSAPREASGRVEGALVSRTVDAALDGAFGADDWVLSFTAPHLYLQPEALRRHGVASETAARVGRQALTALPGIADAVSAADLTADSPRAMAAAVRAEYVTARSGDLVVIPASGVLLGVDAENATSHGTPYEHDQHVPLIVLGKGLPPARYSHPVSPADLAPTLAAWLDVSMPDATGSPLREALPRSGR